MALKRRRNPKIYKQYQRGMMLGPVAMSFLGVIAVVSLVLLYLGQSSRLVVRGYDLDSLKKQRAEVMLENERLEMNAAQLQSLTEIQKAKSVSDLETVKKINYIPSVSTVAVR